MAFAIQAGKVGIAPLSRGTSVLLLFVYGCYLFFQLKTHVDIFNQPSAKNEKKSRKKETGDATKGIAQIGAGLGAAGRAGQEGQKLIKQPPEEEETPQLSVWVAVFTLAVSTALVAICAEFMVRLDILMVYLNCSNCDYVRSILSTPSWNEGASRRLSLD